VRVEAELYIRGPEFWHGMDLVSLVWLSVYLEAWWWIVESWCVDSKERFLVRKHVREQSSKAWTPATRMLAAFPDHFPSDSIQPEPFVQEVEIILLRYYCATVLCIPMANDTPIYRCRSGILLPPLDGGFP
jgi:hypothetical protein